ncbi:HypC/HybG/HupF family hydrogenase formation chaperone [Aquitalea pelogenes]
MLHVGYAIGKLDPEEAARTLALMDQLAAGEQA